LEELREKYLVDFREGQEVVSVDTGAKTVSVNGGDTIRYGKLILAVGSKAVKPPIDGVDLDNVCVLRHISDVEKINAGEAATTLSPGLNSTRM
jgi:NAD(P)H-nitrite reductase large subunit